MMSMGAQSIVVRNRNVIFTVTREVRENTESRKWERGEGGI